GRAGQIENAVRAGGQSLDAAELVGGLLQARIWQRYFPIGREAGDFQVAPAEVAVAIDDKGSAVSLKQCTLGVWQRNAAEVHRDPLLEPFFQVGFCVVPFLVQGQPMPST